MKIDNSIIGEVKRKPNVYKNQTLDNNYKLEKEFYTSLKNYERMLISKSVYEIALWVESNEHNINSRKNININNYSAGDIILINLGENNFMHEFSYIHPAVVISVQNENAFIVPCSSSINLSKFKNHTNEYVVGDIANGFSRKTTLLLNNAKYVDINRIITILGKIDISFLNFLQEKLFEMLLPNILIKVNVIQKELYDLKSKCSE